MTSGRRGMNAGEKALRFLDEHRLDHTPDHYAFAHRYLFGADRVFRDEVAAIVDGGVRITADQVVELSYRPDPPVAANDTLSPELDRITTQVLGIIGDATSEAGAFGRDLTVAAVDLVGSNAQSIHAVVATMIGQAERAEVRLSEMMRRTEALRAELDALRSEGDRDVPTGLLHRRAIEERLDAALIGGRSGTGIAMIETDGLAALNATYGQAVENRIIRTVAETLRDNCAPHQVGRWEDRTFVILFERTSMEQMATIVDLARDALARRHLKLRENDKPIGMVTFSAGLAASRSRDAGALVAAAATLLEQAKRTGNTVVAEPRLIGIGDPDL